MYEHKLEIQLGQDGKYYVFYDNELCKCCKDSKSIRKYVKEHYDVDLNYDHIRGGKLVGIMCGTYWVKQQ